MGLDEELRSMSAFGREYEYHIANVLKETSARNGIFLGFVVLMDPMTISIVSNIKHTTPKDMADIFRTYANYIEKMDDKMIQVDVTGKDIKDPNQA